jgi:hypothetical protein
MDAQTGYLEALLRDTRAAIRKHLTMQQAIDTIPIAPGPSWQLTDRFHRRNVTAAYAELEWEDTDTAPSPIAPIADPSASPKPAKP